MSENPYGPPRAPIGDERFPSPEGTGSFTIGQCLSDAWSDTWSYFPLWLGVGFVGLLLFVLSGLTVIGIFLVWPVLVWGGVRFFLNMTDQRARFADLFHGFPIYGQALAPMLGLVILLWLVGLIGQSVQLVGRFAESTELLVVGFLVNLAWAFVVMVRLYFAILLLVDRGTEPVESLRVSWEVTRGHTLRLIGLVLVNALIYVIGVLAFLVGVIPAVVMGYLLWTSAYRQLVGGPPEEAPPVQL